MFARVCARLTSLDFDLARRAGGSIKPGVERSGTPGANARQFRGRETGDSPERHYEDVMYTLHQSLPKPLSPTSWALVHYSPGVPLRSTPGFMLPPAPRVEDCFLTHRRFFGSQR